ncbi:MAG: type IV secretory system conjugative DNA transfer family protein [Anaerolineae bacterium]|nr:type IV secretory system conjugative DNA transfer family protein [Anaerolineae bacterium]
MNLEMGEIKNGTYFKQWWQEMPSVPKRRWLLFLLGFSVLWLAGAAYAPTAVAGIARLTGPARLLASLCMGGFGFLWGGLETLGLIQETAQEPNLFWIVLALTLPGALFGLIYILDQAPNPLFNMQKMVSKFARSQGRLKEEELAEELAIEQGVPYATLTNKKKKLVKVGLDFSSGEGHLLVAGPTRSGKGLHLTDTLLTWTGPALIVDPKGEQMARTAAWRSQFGPIYCLPGHQINLSAYYDRLLDRDDTAELHAHLMRPWESRETVFAEKALSLFNAAGAYAEAKGLDALHVLIDVAESDMVEALTGLEMVPAARRHVRVFTNGAKPEACRDDRFVTSAFGNFTTRLAKYQKHIDTIAPPDVLSHLVLDPDWVGQNGTVYITYSLQDLQGVGGVVAATIAAILRRQMQQNRRERLLVAIDELPAIGLKNIADYLATCGGYGITLLLYVQSIAQLKALYGSDGTSAILSNCTHQVWYPPADYETAEKMSQLYGMTLKANPAHNSSRGSRQHKDNEGRANTQTNSNQGASWSWQEKPELLPSQMMALPKEQVLVSTQTGAQRFVFLGQRLNPIPLFSKLPPISLLRLPRPKYGPRIYTRWGEAETPTPTPTDEAALLPTAPATCQTVAPDEPTTPSEPVTGTLEEPGNGEEERPSDPTDLETGSIGRDAL